VLSCKNAHGLDGLGRGRGAGAKLGFLLTARFVGLLALAGCLLPAVGCALCCLPVRCLSVCGCVCLVRAWMFRRYLRRSYATDVGFSEPTQGVGTTPT
jgi:hypothetical protein